jgi:hypothetical protein
MRWVARRRGGFQEPALDMGRQGVEHASGRAYLMAKTYRARSKTAMAATEAIASADSKGS